MLVWTSRFATTTQTIILNQLISGSFPKKEARDSILIESDSPRLLNG
jgi:hypothetical protein